MEILSKYIQYTEKILFTEFTHLLKVSGCNQFILATFKYILLKVSQLNLFIYM